MKYSYTPTALCRGRHLPGAACASLPRCRACGRALRHTERDRCRACRAAADAMKKGGHRDR